jgi:hypothetical protein
MDVELQIIPGCPHTAGALELFRRALDDVGLRDVPVRVTVVADAEQAGQLGFAGSPTFLAGGRDLFPDDAGAPAWSCRLYRSAQGLSGLPPVDQLAAALNRA